MMIIINKQVLLLWLWLSILIVAEQDHNVKKNKRKFSQLFPKSKIIRIG